VNAAGADGESLTIRPEPARWLELLATPQAHAWSRSLRRDLGLHENGSVIMSGHQAGFWHPGILAKVFAADAAAAAVGGSAVWVVVDQDANEPLAVPLPRDGLKRAVWNLGPPGPLDVATGSRPPVQPTPAELSGVPAQWSFVREGVARVHHAMEARRDAASLARQCTEAAWSLGLPPMRHIYATALSATSVFGELIDRMTADPLACATAYNVAAAEHPRAMIRALRLGGDRVELPLWERRPDRPRRPVFADDLAAVPRERLAPRALLMTGLLRLGACDLFIHGLGGERYDPVTERWFERWLGGTVRLAPTAMVTATRYLPIADGDLLSPREISRVRDAARRVRYDPGLCGDPATARRRHELSAAISAAPPNSPDRRRLFRDLHALVDDHRIRHDEAIAAFKARAAALTDAASASAVAFDRAWAFPLYPPDMIDGLREEVRRAFAQVSYRTS